MTVELIEDNDGDGRGVTTTVVFTRLGDAELNDAELDDAEGGKEIGNEADSGHP